ncbi:MAG: hypothetical protein JWM25_1682 [Thermoleophilia bacterium]|nr:hypothetical protein [Thermoleophilia bacterium]MCZ4497097.1 hypothetical protein [Thermoleophilia bacterium]
MDSTWTTFLTAALIVGAVAWLGALLWIEVASTRVRSRNDHAAAVQVMGRCGQLTKLLAIPGALVILASGIWLLRETSRSLEGDWWIAACLGLWLVAFVGSTLLRAPECRNIVRLAAEHGPEEEDVRWRTRRVLLLARGELLLLAVGIALAIIQPS